MSVLSFAIFFKKVNKYKKPDYIKTYKDDYNSSLLSTDLNFISLNLISILVKRNLCPKKTEIKYLFVYKFCTVC